MKVSVLKAIYLSRPLRLGVWFVLTSFVLWFLSVLFPLWVLAIGPVLWGLPHLLASFRYSGKSLPLKLSSFVCLSVVFSAAVFWVRQVPLQAFIEDPIRVEMGAFLLFVGILYFFLRRTTQLSVHAVWVSLIGVSALFFPLATAGALVLIHNAVSFIYWIRSAATKGDRTVAIVGFVIFLSGSLLIFLGYGLPIYSLVGAPSEIPLGLTMWDVGSSITAEWAIDYSLWLRATMAYAFGQALHYFVWLRCIPEQHLPFQPPSSFRQSFAYLNKDLGERLVGCLVMTMLILTLGWFLLEFPKARTLYLMIASFHGFSEFAGLCLKKVS